MDIDAALVGRLLAAQFPQWAHLPIRAVVPGGWDNRTFRLGDAMSVRLPSAARYAAQVEKEHRWLPVLGPRLPLAVPVPVAKGAPMDGYPWPWSVYRWLDGAAADVGRVADRCQFADSLARFLVALWAIDAIDAIDATDATDSIDGLAPGAHNFFRGGPLATYDRETRDAIALLSGRGAVDGARATAVWERALAATWRGRPVWVHGDLYPSNLLLQGGQLSAVIDFGCMGVDDPACDFAIAWGFFDGASRARLRAATAVDDATWARGRGWALWKGVITLARDDVAAAARAAAGGTVAAVLADAG